ncbi:MAG TPA: hypothetical protein DCQ04_01885 [Actinobacteria bacterium]|nr:hypothetical protein [Actinomycetota bacterium]
MALSEELLLSEDEQLVQTAVKAKPPTAIPITPGSLKITFFTRGNLSELMDLLSIHRRGSGVAGHHRSGAWSAGADSIA